MEGDGSGEQRESRATTPARTANAGGDAERGENGPVTDEAPRSVHRPPSQEGIEQRRGFPEREGWFKGKQSRRLRDLCWLVDWPAAAHAAMRQGVRSADLLRRGPPALSLAPRGAAMPDGVGAGVARPT